MMFLVQVLLFIFFLSCLLFGVYAGVVWMYALSKEAYVCFFVGFGHV